jgi:hypothetical protein
MASPNGAHAPRPPTGAPHARVARGGLWRPRSPPSPLLRPSMSASCAPSAPAQQLTCTQTKRATCRAVRAATAAAARPSIAPPAARPTPCEWRKCVSGDGQGEGAMRCRHMRTVKQIAARGRGELFECPLQATRRATQRAPDQKRRIGAVSTARHRAKKERTHWRDQRRPQLHKKTNRSAARCGHSHDTYRDAATHPSWLPTP